MAGGSITGVVGQVKWAYYTAAALNGYVVVRSDTNEWSLRGTVIASDSFKLSQRPLFFVAPHAKGEWRWPITSSELIDGRFTATLGAPEP